MTKWNRLHRDSQWLRRVSKRAEMNSSEIDRLKGWVFLLGAYLVIRVILDVIRLLGIA